MRCDRRIDGAQPGKGRLAFDSRIGVLRASPGVSPLLDRRRAYDREVAKLHLSSSAAGTGRSSSLRLLTAVAVVGALVPGCASLGHSYNPYMTGIPEARAAAVSTVDDAAERIAFSDQVTVLGEGSADACATHTKGVQEKVTGYRCDMGRMVTFVIPNAHTREEVVGAVDAEFEAMGIEYSSPLAANLVMAYPSVRDGMVVTGGGQAGGAEIRVSATPFRAGAWRAPSIPRGSSDVSVGGDLDAVSASAVEATGASEVVTVLVSTRYWDTESLIPAAESPAPLRLEYYSEGSVYAFDVALPLPADGGRACAEDGAVDRPTISLVQVPFPRLRFDLRQEATSDDMQRVRDCLTANLSSGAVAVLTPYE